MKTYPSVLLGIVLTGLALLSESAGQREEVDVKETLGERRSRCWSPSSTSGDRLCHPMGAFWPTDPTTAMARPY